MTSKEQCCDDRFEIINETKEYIINATNIDTSPEEMAVLDSICFRLWQLGLTKRNKDKLKELQSILEEYNVRPENIREVLLTGQMFRNQPTLDECIKEWEKRGYELKIDKENKNLIILWNIQKLALFEIDLKYKRIKCKYQIPSRISYEIDKSFAYIDFDLIHLLSKTLKALEVEN